MANDDKIASMLTAKEVGQLLNLHPTTVKRWSDRGLIRAYRISYRGDRRYKREDVTHLLKKMNKKK